MDQKAEESGENLKQEQQAKIKENVKFSPDDTFTSDDGDTSANEEHTKEAKLAATPAVFKRRQATRQLVIQSPTDRIFSPCSQKLLQKKRSTEASKE